MGVLSSTRKQQDTCAEGDTNSEGKVKNVFSSIRTARLEAQGFHLGFLVDVVFAGVAEAVLEAAGFRG